MTTLDTRWLDYCRRVYTARHTNTASCDVCGETVPRSSIAIVLAYGIETGACARCRGAEEPSNDT